MKLNISFSSFKVKHKLKKDQIIYKVKNCKDYKQVENIFNFLLVEKNSFIFESVEKGTTRGRYTIVGLNPDKIWDISKNIITEKLLFSKEIKSYSQYKSKAKLNLANQIYSTFDRAINDKYNVEINQKALNRIKNTL